MLQAQMKLHPYGEKLDIDIGETVHIANIGTDVNGWSYAYYISIKGSNFATKEDVHGVIRGHNRNQNSLKLLQAILNDWGDSACGISAQFMDRVKEDS